MSLDFFVRKFLKAFDDGVDFLTTIEAMRSALPPLPLFRAIYTSKSLIQPEEDEALLEYFRVNNERLEITGILLRHQDHYIQVVEGEADIVMRLIEKIKSDKRHRDFLLVSATEIESRNFGDWRMASATLSVNDWKVWLDTFSEGQRHIDKLIASFVDGRYRK